MTKAQEEYFQNYLVRLRKAAKCEPSGFGEVVKVEIQDLRALLEKYDDLRWRMKGLEK